MFQINVTQELLLALFRHRLPHATSALGTVVLTVVAINDTARRATCCLVGLPSAECLITDVSSVRAKAAVLASTVIAAVSDQPLHTLEELEAIESMRVVFAAAAAFKLRASLHPQACACDECLTARATMLVPLSRKVGH